MKRTNRVEEYNNRNIIAHQRIRSRLEDAEEQSSDLEDRVMESTQAKQQKEKIVFKK